MTIRDMIIAVVCGVLGLIIGVAVCPKRTGTNLDNFTTQCSGFYKYDKCQRIQYAWYSDTTNRRTVGQAILMDGYHAHPRVLGVAYYITEDRYHSLPEKEREGWQKTRYIMDSGLLAFPTLTGMADTNIIWRLRDSYCKTVLCWQSEQDLPGKPIFADLPQKDSDKNDNLIHDRDAMLNINTTKIKNSRQPRPVTYPSKSIPTPATKRSTAYERFP